MCFVKLEQHTKVYLGLTEEEFKTNRYHNQQQSFRKEKYSKTTYQPTYRRSKEHLMNILISNGKYSDKLTLIQT